MSSSDHTVVALRVAASLTDQSDLIRGRAQILAAACGRLRWHSPATKTFTAHVEAALAALNRCAGQFDSAAEAIYRLAVLT